MKQSRLFFLSLLGVVMLAACGNKQQSPADLQRKLDSIAKIESVEQLEMQGVRLGQDISPIQLFYDSLNIQPLPVRYSEDYVQYLPNYTSVPYELVKFMNFEGRTDPKAIALPESAGARLIILAADEGDGLYSLWLYSLDDDYMPVDKLCLYATSKEEKQENDLADPEDKLIQDFVITSDYEVRLTDYSGKFEAEVQRVYHVDMSRKFSETAEIDYEQNGSETIEEGDRGLGVFQQVVEKLVEVLVQILHHIGVDDYQVVVDDIQFFQGLLFIILQHEGVGLHDAHVVDQCLLALDALADDGTDGCVEVIVGVVDPLLHDTACDLLIIIVIGDYLARVLDDPHVDVGHDRGVGISGDFLSCSANTTLDFL